MSNLAAISVIQPWAWLIARPDLATAELRAAVRAHGQIKDIENRDWETGKRGWVLLHASATKLARWDWEAAALFAGKRGVELPMRDAMPRGAFVGAIRIDGCVSQSASRWFVGKWGFQIGAAVPFATPIEGRGSLQFFDPMRPLDPERRPELLRQLTEQIRAAGLAAAFGLEGETEILSRKPGSPETNLNDSRP